MELPPDMCKMSKTLVELCVERISPAAAVYICECRGTHCFAALCRAVPHQPFLLDVEGKPLHLGNSSGSSERDALWRPCSTGLVAGVPSACPCHHVRR